MVLSRRSGNENLYETTLYMRAPLIKDKLFFGVSGTSEQMDGYNTNDFLDKKVDRRRGLNGRMQLRWMPTDKLDVTANVDGEKVNDGVFPLTDMDQADKNPHHVSYNYEGRDKRDTLGSCCAWPTTRRGSSDLHHRLPGIQRRDPERSGRSCPMISSPPRRTSRIASSRRNSGSHRPKSPGRSSGSAGCTSTRNIRITRWI